MNFIKKNKRPIKVIAFLIVLFICLGICNFIVSPVWTDYNNYNTTHGFYEEPDDTIETLFLGTSSVINGIIPIELYEDYGICSYNLATELQPVLASYYWLEEVYRLHSETLDTVVLDVSGLTRNDDEAFYHKALDAMQFSEVKVQAVRSYSDGWEETIQNLIPLLSYHSRWNALGSEDILKAGYEPELSLRGYNYKTNRLLNKVDDYSEITLPLYKTDKDADEKKFNPEALEYFEKMVEFCEEKDIRLVLIKTPAQWNWDSRYHNAVQNLADSWNLEFLDLNEEPYYDEIGYNFATDDMDIYAHPNYWGASKVTSWIGNYLITECGNHDVRGNAAYAFLDEELEDFSRIKAATDLIEMTDPCDYLSYALERDGYTVFLSVKNDAAKKLSDEQRDYFTSIGLEQLADLSNRDSYLAVVENGKIVLEQSESDPETEESGTALISEGVLQDGTFYSLSSGGYNMGDVSSILINGEEYSMNERGLNFVLYDNVRGEVIDSSSFDTHASSERNDQRCEKKLEKDLDSGVSFAELSGKERILYQYNRACEDSKLLSDFQEDTEETGLLSYLSTFCEMEGMDIYLSVKGEGSASLTDEVRAFLAELGLEELAQIEYQDSYLALIRDGKVLFEERNHESSPIEIQSAQALLVSGGSESGDTSSVIIDGEEYSEAEQGINIVVYDTVLQEVIDTAVFDTNSVTPSLQ